MCRALPIRVSTRAAGGVQPGALPHGEGLPAGVALGRPVRRLTRLGTPDRSLTVFQKLVLCTFRITPGWSGMDGSPYDTEMKRERCF